jgi:hypothetical protein
MSHVCKAEEYVKEKRKEKRKEKERKTKETIWHRMSSNSDYNKLNHYTSELESIFMCWTSHELYSTHSIE